MKQVDDHGFILNHADFTKLVTGETLNVGGQMITFDDNLTASLVLGAEAARSLIVSTPGLAADMQKIEDVAKS